MSYEPRDPIRVAVVLDVDDANADLLFIWIGVRAVRLIEQLRREGINADLVRIDLDGYPHLSW
jgi:hypothetical protein